MPQNNSCPLCRATVDPQAPVSHPVIDQQRHTEQMLALFQAVFGQRGAGGNASAQGGAFPGFGSVLGGAGFGGQSRHTEREKEEDRSAFGGMYS